MESNSRSNWIVFVVIFVLIFSLALCVNIYRLFAKDKEPEAATSVMHYQQPQKNLYILATRGKY